MATDTDSGEQDTLPSSAPSLFNDTSPSLPQTPLLANSHFRQPRLFRRRCRLEAVPASPHSHG
jgi:hypothetical protein